MEQSDDNLEKVTQSDGSLGNAQVETREISPQGRYIRLEDKLGSGAYKDVWRAYDTNDGIEVAWNVVKLNRIPPMERKRIKMEVKLLKDIQHKNVIRYYNSWIDREKEQIIFVTEMMSSGSLKHYLRKNTIIRWNAVKRWCRQILTGLQFLHENHIIHRDIKCDNLFINGNTGDLRIGDLGLSTRITEERSALKANNSVEIRQITAVTLTCLGTPEFMAPEMYEEAYDEKVDIYAFGMCVIEMVTGLIPYHLCTSAAQVYKKVIGGDLPPELDLVQAANSRAADFIKLCLMNRHDRPAAKDLLSHPFLQPNPQEDSQEVRNRHNRLYTEMMVIDEGDEEDNELDNELQLMMTTSSQAKSIPASQSMINNHPVTQVILEVDEKGEMINHSDAPADPLDPPLTARTISGGTGSNGSGLPRLRKTLVTDPSPVNSRSNTIVDTSPVINEETIATGDQPAPTDPIHQILIKDVINHPDKPNSIIIFLQLPVLPSVSNDVILSSSGKPPTPLKPITGKPSQKQGEDEIELSLSSTAPNQPEPIVGSGAANTHSSQLLIEFEYDLLHDNLPEILEEMLQLEEFQPSITAFSTTGNLASPTSSSAGGTGPTTATQGSASTEHLNALMKMIEPIITLSTQYLALSSSEPANSSPARYALETLFSSEIYRSCPAYQLLIQKYHLYDSSYSHKSGSESLHPANQDNSSDNTTNILHSETHTIVSQPEDCHSMGLELNLYQDLQDQPEFHDLLQTYYDSYQRVLKEYDQKLAALQVQREKVKETQEKDLAKLNERRDDLDRQLDSMQSKYKERMAEFSYRKTQAVEEHIEKSGIGIGVQSSTSSRVFPNPAVVTANGGSGAMNNSVSTGATNVSGSEESHVTVARTGERDSESLPLRQTAITTILPENELIDGL